MLKFPISHQMKKPLLFLTPLLIAFTSLIFLAIAKKNSHTILEACLIVLGTVLLVFFLWYAPKWQVAYLARPKMPDEKGSNAQSINEGEAQSVILLPFDTNLSNENENNKKYLTPSELFSLENEARKTLAQIIGGILVLVGLGFTAENVRLTQYTAENNQQIAREGQITDRFTKAISQLGDSKLEIRLGGIYALERIARDSEKDHWQVMEVLAAYVREKVSLVNEPQHGQKNAAENQSIEENKIGTDIQAILTVIGRRVLNQKTIELGRIDLSRTNLRGADFSGAKPGRIIFQNADLSGAILRWSVMEGADFNQSKLKGAAFDGARLSKAYFYKCDLQEAHFWRADLSEADFFGAEIRGADFREATLSDASFVNTVVLWNQVSLAWLSDRTQLPRQFQSLKQEKLKKQLEEQSGKR
jgi:hypothetical protein